MLRKDRKPFISCKGKVLVTREHYILPSIPVTEPSSDGERVCLSQHAQFHHVHIYGFYCEGVKDVLVTDAGEPCWLDSGISEKGRVGVTGARKQKRAS